MGFADFGMSEEDIQKREEKRREHEANMAKKDQEIQDIMQQTRDNNKAHSDYQAWQRRHDRWDISFDDWKAGRYTHIVVTKY